MLGHTVDEGRPGSLAAAPWGARNALGRGLGECRRTPADLLNQGPRGGIRLHVQFPPQSLAAGFELGQRRDSLAQLRVAADQRPMMLLGPGGQGHAAAVYLHGAPWLAPRREPLRDVGQGDQMLIQQTPAPLADPVVEPGRVAQTHASEEFLRAPGQQRLHPGRRQVVGGRRCRRVDPEIRPGRDVHLRPGAGDVLGNQAPQAQQRQSQVAPGRRVVQLAPEELRQMGTRAVAAAEGQVEPECQGLGTGQGRQRHPVQPRPNLAQTVHLQAGAGGCATDPAGAEFAAPWGSGTPVTVRPSAGGWVAGPLAACRT